MTPLLTNSFIACMLGVIYGLTMLAQHHRLILKKIPYFIFFSIPIFRLSMLGYIFYRLLHFSFLSSILILGIFLASWWTVILIMKDRIK